MQVSDTGTAVLVTAGRAQLFRYEYRPVMSPEHSPRPYLHPVRTLGGELIIDASPADHPWHCGISIAVPSGSSASFWGGPTFVRDTGYVPLRNHGRVEHQRWLAQRADAEAVTLRHELAWLGPDGARGTDPETPARSVGGAMSGYEKGSCAHPHPAAP